MVEQDRIALIKKLVPEKPDSTTVRPFYHPYRTDEICYYIVPFETNVGKVTFHVDPTGKPIKFKSLDSTMYASKNKSGKLNDFVVEIFLDKYLQELS